MSGNRSFRQAVRQKSVKKIKLHILGVWQNANEYIRQLVHSGTAFISVPWCWAGNRCGLVLWSVDHTSSFPTVTPVPNYTAWWQRHKGTNNLAKVITQWCPSGNRTRNLSIVQPLPQRQHVTCLCLLLRGHNKLGSRLESGLRLRIWLVSF